MPIAGADTAVVKFLTAKDFEPYFKATENGIQLPGDKKRLVFVEKQQGPSSVNDVIRNCAEGDASRCVKAIDADQDWSDNMLMRLARGPGKDKREVDCIKHGKTAQGVSIETTRLLSFTKETIALLYRIPFCQHLSCVEL